MIMFKNKVIIVLSMLISSSAFAIEGSSCDCYKADIEFRECQKPKVQSPTWWDWLTNNESSQLHFYHLIELLHTEDNEVKESTVAVNQKKPKKDKL